MHCLVLDELARCYGAVQIYADPDGKSVGCKRARPDDDYATAEGRMLVVE